MEPISTNPTSNMPLLSLILDLCRPFIRMKGGSNRGADLGADRAFDIERVLDELRRRRPADGLQRAAGKAGEMQLVGDLAHQQRGKRADGGPRQPAGKSARHVGEPSRRRRW